MDNKIIIAPTYLEKIEGPLIFLAGPIQGASRWQDLAIQIINSSAPDLYIASPRRAEEAKGEFASAKYNEQVDWETYHIRRAAENGVIMFWLAKEFEHRCERAYAQTTRFELAEWKVRHERDGIKLAIGIEDGFTGARYLMRRLSQDCPDIKLYSTLEHTCKEAIRLARQDL